MHKAESIFHYIVISIIGILLLMLLLYFLVLPFYHKNKVTTYNEYKVRQYWNGRDGTDTALPEENCPRTCFGEKKTISCMEYNRKYEACQMQCEGVLCGSCVKQGVLNELRCFQLYSK